MASKPAMPFQVDPLKISHAKCPGVKHRNYQNMLQLSLMKMVERLKSWNILELETLEDVHFK